LQFIASACFGVKTVKTKKLFPLLNIGIDYETITSENLDILRYIALHTCQLSILTIQDFSFRKFVALAKLQFNFDFGLFYRKNTKKYSIKKYYQGKNQSNSLLHCTIEKCNKNEIIFSLQNNVKFYHGAKLTSDLFSLVFSYNKNYNVLFLIE
jgi:hypothetical protein